MKITAITRYKHGALYLMLQKMGWSQSELARRAGVSPCEIGRIINLRARPSPNLADKLQVAFALAGAYFDITDLYPEEFAGLPAGFVVEQTADIDPERLMAATPAPEITEGTTEELSQSLQKVMSTLPDHCREVIEARYMEGKTLEQVGYDRGCTRERVRQIEAEALRMLRHPSRARILAEYSDAIEVGVKPSKIPDYDFVDLSTAAEHQPEEPPKRRRGRPRKPRPKPTPKPSTIPPGPTAEELSTRVFKPEKGDYIKMPWVYGIEQHATEIRVEQVEGERVMWRVTRCGAPARQWIGNMHEWHRLIYLLLRQGGTYFYAPIHCT